jgi:hypothetical protein
MEKNFFITEAFHQMDDEMENEVVAVVVVVVQHLNLNDEIHFHYVHVMIVLEHLIEKDLHDVASIKHINNLLLN